MPIKILVYLIYALLFTYCYYYLNKKLTNKWILIGYPLFFCASLYPIKLIFDALIPLIGKPLAGQWLLLMLYAVSMLSLFNFIYGVVNRMVNNLADFQQQYGMPHLQPARWYLSNRVNIVRMYQFFFYTGGISLYGVAVFTSKIG